MPARLGVRRLSPVLCLALLGACATQDGVGRYRIATIGNAQRTVAAKVLSADPVHIQTRTGEAGGVAGGLLGGAVAAEGSDNAAVIIAGVIAGAIVGSAIESAANVYDGTEYVIETETGALLTVAQVNSGSEIFSKGDRVVLVYGFPHRLIRDPR